MANTIQIERQRCGRYTQTKTQGKTRREAVKGNNNANHCMFEVQMNKRFNVKKIGAFPQCICGWCGRG